MKTVPTLCATSTGIGISALGLALARLDHLDHRHHDHEHDHDHDRPRRRRSPNNNDHLHPRCADPGTSSRPPHSHRASLLAPPSSDMTSTATCTVQTVDTYATPSSYCSPFGFSARQSLRSASSQSAGPSRSTSDNALLTVKRDTRLREGQSMPPGLERSARNSGEASPSSSSFPYQQNQSWLKRISFSSRDSSQYSIPHPESTVLSPSNGSIALSTSGSTAPMLPSSHAMPSTSAPNKLVKRSSSLRRERSYSVQGGSKIPLPVLKRPATSHRRSATLQERRTAAVPRAEDAFRHSQHGPLAGSPTESQWRSFFTPRLAISASTISRRRNSTSIPNPIKRVYPDRKYHPVLLSARESIDTADLELDIDEYSERSGPVSDAAGRLPSSPFVRPATVPMPVSTSRHSQEDIDVRQFLLESSQSETRDSEGDGGEQTGDDSRSESASRRSFSISDLLPADTQKWKRPLSNNKPSVIKYRRRGGRASSSTPSSMGNRQSISNDESDPRANSKHRDVANVAPASASPTLSNNPLTEIDLNLSSNTAQPSAANHPIVANLPHQKDTEQNTLSTTVVSSTASRRSRKSVTYSDFATNIASSDSDVRSGDDDGLDSQNDTIHDSVRTKMTKTSPGRRGPPIEQIFGDSPPYHIHGKHTMLKDFLKQGPLHDHGYSLKPKHSIIHEEENVSTPARSTRRQSLDNSPAFTIKASRSPADLPSSPPTMPSLSDLRKSVERFPDIDDDGESSWSFGDDEDEDQQPQLPSQNRFAHLGITSDLLSPFANQGSSSAATTPQRPGARHADKDARSSIFDWSEQPSLDKSPLGRSPPRPKTVHGKKDAENRGSRSVGRRAPSGVHARSQSVPVAQEADGKRSQVVTNKFGTWGVGSKGVTEDWNEDFDFGDAQSTAATLTPGEEKRLDSGVGMFVPKSIRDQQTNVLANIGLLRDWGLLIEELKELKGRGITLDLLNGENKPMWNEVDAMIDLADQESDEHTLAPRYSPPSSPSFNYEAFDDPLPATATSTHPSLGTPELPLPVSPPEANFDLDVFDVQEPGSPIGVEHEVHITPATPNRPRKDSEAVARSVIEALQQKRITSDPGPALEGGRTDKVHFDTATLKRIIPYVQDLRDRVKKVIRDVEDLLPSPKSLGSIGSNGGRSLRRRLQDPQESPTMRRRSRRSTNVVENTPSDEGVQSPTDDLAAHMRLMTVI